jgi:hypothetical protein
MKSESVAANSAVHHYRSPGVFHTPFMPPSAMTTEPAMKLAQSDTRKMTTGALVLSPIRDRYFSNAPI